MNFKEIYAFKLGHGNGSMTFILVSMKTKRFRFQGTEKFIISCVFAYDQSNRPTKKEVKVIKTKHISSA